MVTQPIMIRTFNKSLSEVFPGVPTVVYAVLVLRHNSVSDVTFAIPARSPALAALLADGARVTVDLNLNRNTPGSDPDWLRVFSGPVSSVITEGPSEQTVYTVRASSDWAMLRSVLGWQVPGAALTAQDGSEYYTLTGDAETVVKTVVQANMVTRLGLPVSVASNQNRGSSLTAAFRMHPLADVLFPAVEQAGVGVSMLQIDSSIVCDVYEPTTLTVPLTEQSGAVRAWSLTRQSPQITRVVVGGSGEGTARIFRGVERTAVESAHGLIRESFRDARDTDVVGILLDRANEVLDENGASAGIHAVLADTPALQYGRDLKVGDVVPLGLGGGDVITETLREVTLTWDSDQGFRASSTLGTVTDDPSDRLANVVSRVMKSLRHLGRV